MITNYNPLNHKHIFVILRIQSACFCELWPVFIQHVIKTLSGFNRRLRLDLVSCVCVCDISLD